MKEYTKLPKKQLYFILTSCAVIIFAASLETMFRVKDVSLYHQWVQSIEHTNWLEMDNHESLNGYIAANLSLYFFTVIIPMSYGIHSYFAYTRIRISGLFVFLWVVLLLGGLAYTTVELNFYSPFYYIRIIGYLVLLVTTFSLINVIDERKLL